MIEDGVKVVFRPDPKRSAIEIKNRTTNSIFVDFDEPASNTNSFEIFAQGTYSESTSAAAQKINVMEIST